MEGNASIPVKKEFMGAWCCCHGHLMVILSGQIVRQHRHVVDIVRSFVVVVAIVAYVRFLQFRTKNASPVTNCT